VEVEADGGKKDVDAIALAVVQVIAAHTVLVFDVADNGFDSGSSFHLAFDGGGNTASLPCDPDFELVLITMPFVAFVDMASIKTDTRTFLQIGQDGSQGVPIEGIAVMSFGMKNKLPALRFCDRRNDRDLATELVRRAGFAFADALNLRRM